MSNRSKVNDQRFWKKWRESGAVGTIASAEKDIKKILLVWNEHQIIPARLYGDAHFGAGKYDVLVCRNPNVEFAELGKERALIYHFSGSNSG